MSDPGIKCVGCGCPLGYEYMGENGFACCEDCELVEAVDEMLYGIQHGDRDRAVADLFEAASHLLPDDRASVGHLVVEAADAAKRGDLDEVELLLRNAARPKFASVTECQEQYEAAMAEKLARERV